MRHYPLCIFHNTSVAGAGFCRSFSSTKLLSYPLSCQFKTNFQHLEHMEINSTERLKCEYMC